MPNEFCLKTNRMTLRPPQRTIRQAANRTNRYAFKDSLMPRADNSRAAGLHQFRQPQQHRLNHAASDYTISS